MDPAEAALQLLQRHVDRWDAERAENARRHDGHDEEIDKLAYKVAKVEAQVTELKAIGVEQRATTTAVDALTTQVGQLNGSVLRVLRDDARGARDDMATRQQLHDLELRVITRAEEDGARAGRSAGERRGTLAGGVIALLTVVLYALADWGWHAMQATGH